MCVLKEHVELSSSSSSSQKNLSCFRKSTRVVSSQEPLPPASKLEPSSNSQDQDEPGTSKPLLVHAIAGGVSFDGAAVFLTTHIILHILFSHSMTWHLEEVVLT